MNSHFSLRRRIGAAVLCGILLLPAQVTMQARAQTGGQVIAARADGYLSGLARAHVFSGSVLLARNGTVLLDKGYGMADAVLHAPNTPGTAFRITALSDQFYAAALLQLQDQGKVSVRDRLCRYLPSCPASWRAITIEQVLTGSTGIHDYFDDPANAAISSRPATLPQLIALLERYQRLDARPGTQCESSYNPSLPLLNYLVGRIAGIPATTYIEQHLLTPLGLRHTGPDQPPLTAPAHALGYTAQDAPATDHVASSFLGGALYATVNDLYRWDQALLAASTLAPSALGAMFSPACTYCPPQCNPGQTTGGSGYAWDIGVVNSYRYRQFGGGIPGFISYEAYYPDQHATLIILSNEDNAAFGNLQQFLQNAIVS